MPSRFPASYLISVYEALLAPQMNQLGIAIVENQFKVRSLWNRYLNNCNLLYTKALVIVTQGVY